jgi:hypothetical protein
MRGDTAAATAAAALGLLLLTTFATATSGAGAGSDDTDAGATGATTTPPPPPSSPSSPPSRGLDNLGQSACQETAAFCEKTVLTALGEDPKLAKFLQNVRSIAREAAPGSADGYSTAVLDPTSLKFPEMLALGCCLAAVRPR